MGKKNNLVRNASFLMIAAMISKIIGLSVSYTHLTLPTIA